MTDAKEYGKALYLLAKENGNEERVKEDVNTLLAILKNEKEYLKLLDTPALSKTERVNAADGAFGALDGYLVNTVKIMTEKRMAHAIPSALEGFSLAYDEDKGIERVEAVSAVALGKEQLETLKTKLEKLTGKTIIIENTVDKSILGGMTIRYMGVQLDGSVKTRLEAFEKSLKNLVI